MEGLGGGKATDLKSQWVQLKRPLGIAPRLLKLTERVVASGPIVEGLVVKGIIASREDTPRSFTRTWPHDLINETIGLASFWAIIVVLAGTFCPGPTTRGLGTWTRVDNLNPTSAD
jgi:hypothetical protein